MFIWDFKASVFGANHALGILNLKHYFFSGPLFFLENYVRNTSVALEKVLTTDGNTLSLYCARCALPIYNMPTIRSYVGHKYFIANGLHKKR